MSSSMRQRATIQSSPSSRGSPRTAHLQQHLRRRGDASTSWEITTSEDLPQPPQSPQEEEDYLQSQQRYQNGQRPSSLQNIAMEDFHSIYRTALHTPDNQYRQFLLGQTARRKSPAIVTRICCAKTCAGFSAVGMTFLVFVGILIDTQPLYIKGMLPQMVLQTDDASKPVTQYLIPTERLPAASTAYQAALAYFFTAVVCLLSINPNWCNSYLYRWRKRYQDIPDHLSSSDSTIPTFHNIDETDIPAQTVAYQPGMWHQMTASGRQWLASKGWFSGFRRRRRKHAQKTG